MDRRHDPKDPATPDGADDIDGWTDEPGDPDMGGPAAEFVDEPLLDDREPPPAHP